MNIIEIGRKAHAINGANGWEVFSPTDWPTTIDDRDKIHFVCTHMSLVHAEVSEATEAVRHLDKPHFTEELADVVIRAVSIAHGLGLDLDNAIYDKLAKNATRGYRHGGKAV